MSLKSNKIFALLLIFMFDTISSSLIKIPFKISKSQIFYKSIEKYIENMLFEYKLYSLIEVGQPPQSIEAFFDLKISNYFISNICKDCLSFYSYKKSKTFIKTETDEKPFLYGSTFYGNETFYFYDEKNEQKIIENMLIFLPELKEDKEIKNCLNIGLKFPDYSNNNYQETFIQQLKHKNKINQYLWTLIFYDNNKDKLKNDYEGEFIFGDIFNDYYKIIDNRDFSFSKVTHTYTGIIKKKNSIKEEIMLEWGIQFDEIYFLNSKNNLNSNNNININTNIISIHDLTIEFDINLNVILGPSNYYNNIITYFFNDYFKNNICKESFIRNKMYKFIYCNVVNFTKNDLEKFPILNLKNNILRYIFNLDYKDLFSLTNDNKYYIFNIMLFNILNNNNEEQRWVFGLPFLKKYHFIFDSDNKLIYFYNKNGKFSDEFENINNKSEINNKDVNKKDKLINIEKKYIFIIFIIIFVNIFFIFLCIILFKKILLKKGYILKRIKKANELMDDDYDYSNHHIISINDIKNEHNLFSQQCEMQIKK